MSDTLHTHTPGPWFTGVGGLAISTAFTDESGNQHNCGIADVLDHRPGGTNQDHANARLIAAAPELLEACKNAADWLSRSVRIDDQEQAADIREVIAKVEWLPSKVGERPGAVSGCGRSQARE